MLSCLYWFWQWTCARCRLCDLHWSSLYVTNLTNHFTQRSRVELSRVYFRVLHHNALVTMSVTCASLASAHNNSLIRGACRVSLILSCQICLVFPSMPLVLSVAGLDGRWASVSRILAPGRWCNVPVNLFFNCFTPEQQVLFQLYLGGEMM